MEKHLTNVAIQVGNRGMECVAVVLDVLDTDSRWSSSLSNASREIFCVGWLMNHKPPLGGITPFLVTL